MTQEEKQLLLRDLCARLPYGVEIQIKEWAILDTELKIGHIQRLQNDNIKLKPYLRSMTSMTEEEKEELIKNFWGSHTIKDRFEEICWYLSRHFDINGLIEKGLAIAVTEENNPYEKEQKEK